VPHERHVVVNVEIRSPRVVIQILHPPAHDLQRMLVRDTQIFSHQGLPRGKCLRELRLFCWKALSWNSEQQIWIRRETRPLRNACEAEATPGKSAPSSSRSRMI